MVDAVPSRPGKAGQRQRAEVEIAAEQRRSSGRPLSDRLRSAEPLLGLPFGVEVADPDARARERDRVQPSPLGQPSQSQLAVPGDRTGAATHQDRVGPAAV